jgi:hypothetical protein
VAEQAVAGEDNDEEDALVGPLTLRKSVVFTTVDLLFVPGNN